MKYYSNLIFKLCLLVLPELVCAQNGTWTWMKGDSIFQSAVYGTQGVSSPNNKPRATYEAMEWRDLSGNFWLYDNYDLWKFDPVSLNWTWVKGSHGASSAGIYGTKGLSTASNFPGTRGYGAATWVDNNNNLWLFGGAHPNGCKNDLWKFNISTSQWTWVKGDSTFNAVGVFGTKGVSNSINNPPSLCETSASWFDGNNLWLFGGTDCSANYFNTLWKYNINFNEWTWVSGSNVFNDLGSYGIKGLTNATNVPSARACYTKWITNDTLWLFGGNFFGDLNDLWRYTISNNQWTWMSGSDTVNDVGIYLSKCVSSTNCYPHSRSETRACWKDFNNRLWLYGGLENGPAFDDLWTYDPNSNKWTWVSGNSSAGNGTAFYGTQQMPNANNNPGERAGAPAWLDGFNNLWIFGGYSGLGLLGDLWRYQINPACAGTVNDIKEFNSLENFHIYPIPFKEKLSIEFKIKSISDIKVTMRNLQGETIISHVLTPENKYPKIELATKEFGLADGIYVLDISINQKVYTRKIIKLSK